MLAAGKEAKMGSEGTNVMLADCLKCQPPAVWAHLEAWIDHVGGQIGFDCHRHAEPDTGPLRWIHAAPTRLRDDVRTYFHGRREDG